MTTMTSSSRRRWVPVRPLTECGDSFVEIPSLHHETVLVDTHTDYNPYSCLDLEEPSVVGSGLSNLSGKKGSPQDQKILGTMVECPPKVCSADDCAQLALALPVIIKYLIPFGFDPSGFDSSSTIQHWQRCSAYCGWMKFLKYKFAAYFSHYLHTELPPAPFPIPDHPAHLLGSTAGRFMQKVLRSPLGLTFATGVNYLKKGMPRALDSELKAAILKTEIALTTPQSLPVIPDCPSTFGELLEECRRTVREIFTVGGKVVKFTENDLHRPCAPSIKACFQAPRSELGTLGCLVRDGFLAPAPAADLDGVMELDPEDFMDIDRQELAKVGYSSMVYREAVEYDASMRQVRCGGGNYECMEDDEGGTTPLRVTSRFKQVFKDSYRKVYEQVRSRTVSQKFDVKLVALAESLKIRVISKGPCYKYFLLKPLQVFLSKLLGCNRAFALTRNTDLEFTTDLLNDVFGAREGLFHSLDYEGATDNFNPLVSEVICDEMSNCMDLDAQQRSDFRDALTGHIINGKRQRWGQLMGSVISFVVLCVGNAAVVRRSLELTDMRLYNLCDAPILINGDDGLVRASPPFLSTWKSLATLVGLKPSVGKVYSHPRYANINSTSFWLSNSSTLVHVPYVNMGLVCGLSRSSELSVDNLFDEFDPRASSLGARHRALMDSCPPGLRLEVHKIFLEMHRDLLCSPSLSEISWYAPESLGGLGLCPIFATNDLDVMLFGPSELDEKIINHLISFPDSSLHRLPSDAPLAVRQSWTRSIPFRRTQLESFIMCENDIGLLDVSTYYLIPGFLAAGLSDPLHQLTHNRRIWRRLRRRFSRVPSQSLRTLDLM